MKSRNNRVKKIDLLPRGPVELRFLIGIIIRKIKRHRTEPEASSGVPIFSYNYDKNGVKSHRTKSERSEGVPSGAQRSCSAQRCSKQVWLVWWSWIPYIIGSKKLFKHPSKTGDTLDLARWE